MTKNEKQLTVLAAWLKTDFELTDERDGVLERKIKEAIENVKHSIGDQIEEILTADDELLEIFLDCTND